MSKIEENTGAVRPSNASLLEGGDENQFSIKQLSKQPNIDVFVKHKDSSSIKTVRSYTWIYCFDVFCGIIALALGSVVSFTVPYLLGVCVDAMIANDKEKINRYCFYMIFICIISGATSGVRGAIFNIMSYKIARDIKYDVFWYLVRKDISFFDERKTGDILSRISQDVQVLQDGLSTSISMLMRCGYVIVCVIIILASISWKLTLCAVAGIAVTSTGMKYFWSKGF